MRTTNLVNKPLWLNITIPGPLLAVQTATLTLWTPLPSMILFLLAVDYLVTGAYVSPDAEAGELLYKPISNFNLSIKHS